MSQSQSDKSEDSRWQVVRQRDAGASGQFVYAVATTGIYCRPGCSSRLPKRENVLFFDQHTQAEEAGFRPCKRCLPQLANKPDPISEVVIEACLLIEEAETAPTLEELAAAVAMSPSHFHRLFKKSLGVTPKQYAAEIRLRRVRGNLLEDQTVTDAIYNAGFQSSSRFYETATAALGMTPKEYQKGGQDLSILYTVVESYLGWVLVAGTRKGICRIDFAEKSETLLQRIENLFPKANLMAGDDAFQTVVNQVIKYIEMPLDGLNLPLDVQGTAFQLRVWQALQGIKPGTTASYGQIASKIGNPKASRAVAQACGANKLAVAIPCHRVVRGNGELGGYRWGIERKMALLEREATTAD